MKITVDNLNTLVDDLQAADAAAKKKVGRKKDSGSCNSDAVAFPFDRMPHPRMRTAIEATLKENGFHAWFRKKFGQSFLSVSTTVSGQAGRRYEATQVMVESLKKAGWDVFVDYVVD